MLVETTETEKAIFCVDIKTDNNTSTFYCVDANTIAHGSFGLFGIDGLWLHLQCVRVRHNLQEDLQKEMPSSTSEAISTSPKTLLIDSSGNVSVYEK